MGLGTVSHQDFDQLLGFIGVFPQDSSGKLSHYLPESLVPPRFAR